MEPITFNYSWPHNDLWDDPVVIVMNAENSSIWDNINNNILNLVNNDSIDVNLIQNANLMGSISFPLDNEYSIRLSELVRVAIKPHDTKFISYGQCESIKFHYYYSDSDCSLSYFKPEDFYKIDNANDSIVICICVSNNINGRILLDIEDDCGLYPINNIVEGSIIQISDAHTSFETISDHGNFAIVTLKFVNNIKYHRSLDLPPVTL